MRPPHPEAAGLGGDGDGGEVRRQQPVEGHAALHDDLQDAAGLQVRRCVGDERSSSV